MIITEFNCWLRLVKKFNRSEKKEINIKPYIKLSKKFSSFFLIISLLNNLPVESKLKAHKKEAKKIFINPINEIIYNYTLL